MRSSIIILIFCSANIQSIKCEINLKVLLDYQGLETVPCIIRLCELYFKPERALKGSLAIVNLIPNPTLFQRRILELLNQDPKHKLGVMVKDARRPHWNASHVTEKAQNYFMLLSNSSELIDTITQLKNLPTWNPLAQVLILFTNEMDDEYKSLETFSVMQELFQYNVLNVNVMSVRYNTSIIEVVTWFPYEGNSCADRITKIRLIDECEYVEVADMANTTSLSSSMPTESKTTLIDKKFVYLEKHYHTEYFPKIPNKLHDCPLRIASAVWEPFVVANGSAVTKGLEVLMLFTITEKMKLQPQFTIVEQEKAHALLKADNVSGLYADLLQKKANIMIGGLSENPISRKLLSSTIPYYQDDLTWCVAKAKLAPNWINVFIIFNITTWTIAIVTLHALAAILHYFVKKEGFVHENILWSFLIMLALNINFYGHYWPRRTFIKVFLAGVMIYGLHFSVAYNSFLIAVLTRPRFETQVSDIGAAIEKNFNMVGGENMGVHFEKPDRISQHISRVFEPCRIPDTCLKKLKLNGNLAVAISRQHSRNTPGIMPTDMYCFPTIENIYTYSVAMIVERNYHLLSKINGHIRSISESGLLTKWEQESQTTKISSESSGEPNNDGIILKLEHIEGAFLLGFCGICISTVAFGFEHLHFWLSMKNRSRELRRSRTKKGKP